METEPQIENTDVQIREEHKIWHKKIFKQAQFIQVISILSNNT